METKVTFIYDYRSIELPKEMTKLILPDMDEFMEMQCQVLAEKHSTIELPEGQEHLLTDDMVKKEEIQGVETVEQYRDTLKREIPAAIVSEQVHALLMNYLMPQLVQRSTFEINDEEATRESTKRLEAFEENARRQELTLEEAGRKDFGIPTRDNGEIRQCVLYLGRTSFLFRILGRESLKRQGQVFDLASYAGYVKDLTEVSGMPEEQVRELVPLHVYMEEVPALTLLDEMSTWIAPQIRLTKAHEGEPDDA
ncbi:MAG: hypothetical protein GX838_00930 [Clostridiaceae bacterium]|nr:hypothetical protein [Clostridiaceae bacterium]